MAFDLIAELEALIEALDHERVEYALCGGLALGLHGHPRATMDIDLLVQRAQLADAMRIARGRGFDVPGRKMIFGLASGTPREVQRLSKLDPQSNDLMPLDLLVVNAELEAAWRGRAAFDVGGAWKAPTMAPPSEIDMSPAALRRRLEQLRALYKLMRHLGTARPIGAGRAPARTT